MGDLSAACCHARGKMPSSYFMVEHHVLPGKEQAVADFWAKSDKEATAKMMKESQEKGFHCPCTIGSGSSTRFCLWEGKDGKSAMEMQIFIDNLFSSLMNNIVWEVDVEKAALPFKSFFENPEEAPAEMPALPSSFFVVSHFFKPGMAGKWWEQMMAMTSDKEAQAKFTENQHNAGFHNHAFLPIKDNRGAFCLWEGKDKTAVDMQEHIDGPLGPSMGCFINIVLPIDLVPEALPMVGSAPFFKAKAQSA